MLDNTFRDNNSLRITNFDDFCFHSQFTTNCDNIIIIKIAVKFFWRLLFLSLIMSDFLAPWRSYLQRALHRNRSQIFSRYFSLATVSEAGYPTNRMVVFRGFLDNSNQIKMVTDTRSEKFTHLTNNPHGEICWYFAKTREQFRLRGKVELITENYDNEKLFHERKKSWANLSRAGKEQFYWANPGELLIENLEIITDNIDEQKPVSNFCLLLFNAEKVDHLELRRNPQSRVIYQLNDENKWLMNRVNP
jgi:pyridoxamine 5'-phosphate oxidase